MKKTIRRVLSLILAAVTAFSLCLVAFADDPGADQTSGQTPEQGATQTPAQDTAPASATQYVFSEAPLPAGASGLDSALASSSAAVNLAEASRPVTRYICPLAAADTSASARVLDGDLVSIASVVSSSPSVVAAVQQAGSSNAVSITGKAAGTANITVTLHSWNDAQSKAANAGTPDNIQTLTYAVSVYDTVTVGANTGGDAASNPLSAAYGSETKTFATLQALLDDSIVQAGNEVVVKDLALTENLTVSKAITLRFATTAGRAVNTFTGSITAKAAGTTVDNVECTGSILFEKENATLKNGSSQSVTFQGGGVNTLQSHAVSGALTFANPSSAKVEDGTAGSLVLNKLALTSPAVGFTYQNGSYTSGALLLSFTSTSFNTVRSMEVSSSPAAGSITAAEQAVLDRVLTYNKITGGNYQVFSIAQSGSFPTGVSLLLDKSSAVKAASPYFYRINAAGDKLEKASASKLSTTAEGKLSVPLVPGSYVAIDQSISNLTGKPKSSSGSSSKDRDTLLEASEVKSDLRHSDKGDVVSFDVNSEYNVCYDVFELMKKKYSDRSIEFTGRGYIWRFKGSEIDLSDDLLYMDTRIVAESDYEDEIDDLAKKVDYEIISFNYTGKFPGKAGLMLQPSISSSKYYLYRYNPSKDRLELVYSGLKEDRDGYVRLLLTHSYDYILTDSQVKGAYTGSALDNSFSSSSASSSSASSSRPAVTPSSPSAGIVTPSVPAVSSSTSSQSPEEPSSSSAEEPSSQPQGPSSAPEISSSPEPSPDEPVSVPGSPEAPGPSPWLYIAIGVAVVAALGLAIAVGVTIGRR